MLKVSERERAPARDGFERDGEEDESGGARGGRIGSAGVVDRSGCVPRAQTDQHRGGIRTRRRCSPVRAPQIWI